MNRKLAVATLLLGSALLAGPAAAVHVSFSTGDHVALRGDLVVITPEDSPPAEISPAGVLRIDGRRVAVNERNRMRLARYNEAFHRIEEHAIEVGLQGADVGISAVVAAVVAIATQDGDHVERRVEGKAKQLKEEARLLCHEVKGLKRLQDGLAAELPAFRPYALMDDGDEPDCRFDD